LLRLKPFLGWLLDMSTYTSISSFFCTSQLIVYFLGFNWTEIYSKLGGEISF